MTLPEGAQTSGSQRGPATVQSTAAASDNRISTPSPVTSSAQGSHDCASVESPSATSRGARPATQRIRPGILSRQASEREEAEPTGHLHSASEEDDTRQSDSGSLPRRFPPNLSSAASSLRNGKRSQAPSHLSSPAAATGYFSPSGGEASSSSSRSHLPLQSKTSLYRRQASGNSAAGPDWNEEGVSTSGITFGSGSLSRAKSVSSVSSVNSTSSMEAVPFRAAPLGNVRLGYGGYGGVRNAPKGGQGYAAARCSDEEVQNQDWVDQGPRSADFSRGETSQRQLTDAGPQPPGKQRLLPKGPSDDWHYRTAPGMGAKTGTRSGAGNFHTIAATRASGRPSLADSLAAEADGNDDEVFDAAIGPSSLFSTSRSTKPSIRSKLAKRAGKLGLKPLTNVAASTSSSHPALGLLSDQKHSPSSAEMRDFNAGLAAVTSASSVVRMSPEATYRAARSYFSSSSVNSNALTSPEGESMMRTSSVTNAPLIVSKHPPGPPGSGPAPSPGLMRGSPLYHPLSYTSPKVSPQQTIDDVDPLDDEAEAVGRAGHRDQGGAVPPTIAEGNKLGPQRVPSRSSLPGLLGTVHLSDQGQPFSLPSPARSPSPGQARVASPAITPAQQIQMDAQAGLARAPAEPSGATPGPNPRYGEPWMQEGRQELHELLYPTRPHSTSISTLQTAKPETGRGSGHRFSGSGAALNVTQRRPVLTRAATSESVTRKSTHSEDIRPNGKGIAIDEKTGVSNYWSGRPVRAGSSSPNNSSASSRSVGSAENASPPLRLDIPSGGLAPISLLSRPGSANRLQSPAPPSAVTSDVTILGREGQEEDVLSPVKGGSPEKSVNPLPAIVESHLSSDSATVDDQPGQTQPPSEAVSINSSTSMAPVVIRHVEPRVARPGLYVAHLDQVTKEPLGQESLSTPPAIRPRGASVTRSTRVESDFQFGEILGEGSYSTVMEAWDMKPLRDSGASSKTKTEGSAMAALAGKRAPSKQRESTEGAKVYAVKVLDKMHILKEKKQKYVSLEKEALSLLIRHPGIVTLYWTFQDRDSLYFVLELASNGELLSFIKKLGSFDRECTRYYGAQLVEAIDGMHQAGVLHRDLKPENILLDKEMRIKFTDFGSAKIVKESAMEAKHDDAEQRQRPSSFVGTAEYVSPELLTDKHVSEASDWWAFGCLLYQMLCGRPPFKGVSEYQTFQKIMKRDFVFPDDLFADARHLIDSIMVLVPDQRLKPADIRAHRFFDGIDWSAVWMTKAPELKAGIVNRPVTVRHDMSSEGEGDNGLSMSSHNAPASASEDGGLSAHESAASVDQSDRQSALANDGWEVQDADDDDSSFSDSHPPAPRRRGFSAGASAAEAMLSLGTSGGKRASNFFRMAAGIALPETKTEGSSGTSNESSLLKTRPSVPSFPSMRGVTGSNARQQWTHRWNSNSAVPGGMEGPTPSTPSRTSLLQSQTVAATEQFYSSLATSWAALLLPHESLLYSCPILHKTTGNLLRSSTKKRQLLLTDFPRLLCVKETNDQLRVKSEVILGLPYAAMKSLEHRQWGSVDDDDEEDEEEEEEQGEQERGMMGSTQMTKQSSAAPVLSSPIGLASSLMNPSHPSPARSATGSKDHQQQPPRTEVAAKRRAIERRESFPFALRSTAASLNAAGPPVRQRQASQSAATASSLMEASPNFMTSIEQKSIRTFIVTTPAKSYYYEDPSGDATHWVKSIAMAAKRSDRQSS